MHMFTLCGDRPCYIRGLSIPEKETRRPERRLRDPEQSLSAHAQFAVRDGENI